MKLIGIGNCYIVLQFQHSPSQKVFNDNKPLQHFAYENPVERQSHSVADVPQFLFFQLSHPVFFGEDGERRKFFFSAGPTEV